jgi:hypothetical protein
MLKVFRVVANAWIDSLEDVASAKTVPVHLLLVFTARGNNYFLDLL